MISSDARRMGVAKRLWSLLKDMPDVREMVLTSYEEFPTRNGELIGYANVAISLRAPLEYITINLTKAEDSSGPDGEAQLETSGAPEGDAR